MSNWDNIELLLRQLHIVNPLVSCLKSSLYHIPSIHPTPLPFPPCPSWLDLVLMYNGFICYSMVIMFVKHIFTKLELITCASSEARHKFRFATCFFFHIYIFVSRSSATWCNNSYTGQRLYSAIWYNTWYTEQATATRKWNFDKPRGPSNSITFADFW